MRKSNKLSKIQKSLLILMLLAFAGMFLYSVFPNITRPSDTSMDKGEINFSLKSGFYDHGISVELSTAPDTEIYYTLDGSVPSMGKEHTSRYKEAIYIEADDVEYACTIRAAAYQDGVLVSDIESQTYLMGVNVNQRYNIPVLSVTGSPEDFYNYEDGIMVHGKLDEEYIAENSEWAEAFERRVIPVLGNFYQRGREAEKEVVVTLFNANGEILLSQNAGFRLYGAFSRMKNQPSFRLYARSEYDEINDFDHTFFADQYTAPNTLQSEYKRVIVRNGGNDNGYGFMRSELATRIAKEAGFRDAPSASPVCVYLNGEYYGQHWFINNFDDNYFTETYGEYPGEMYVYEGNIHNLGVDETEEDENYLEIAREYNEQIAFFENADLTLEENWKKLNDFMDVENFLQYVAIQYYVANDDCLSNNYRVYRYYSPADDYIPDTVFDGKFRLLLFDMDQALGLEHEYSHVDRETYTLTADHIDGEDDFERLFANILKRQDCRETYIRYFLSMMNYYYSENYVNIVLNEMHNSRMAEITYMIENTDLLTDNFIAPDITEFDYVANEMALVLRFTRLRPDYAMQDLYISFGEMTPYTLYLENSNQASITLDYATMHDTTFTGSYFSEVPLQVTASPQVGYQFDYWLVNGETVSESSLLVEEAMIKEGKIMLECVCSPKEDADLCISGVKSRNGDFIQITNISTVSKNLGEYCLTDNASDRKSTLPAKEINPGETVTIYCKNYSEVEALGQPVTNFNLKAGETLSLYGSGGRLIDSVAVPELGSREGIWQRDMYTGSFKEVIPKH